MLKSAGAKDYCELLKFCRRDNFGARILSAFDSRDSGNLTLIDGNGEKMLCAVSLKGDTAVVRGSLTPDIADSLTMLGCKYIFSAQCSFLCGKELSCGEIGVLTDFMTPPFSAEKINAENLRDIFELIKYDLPEDDRKQFGCWYVELSHKIRHSAARVFALRDNGKIVSLAVTMAETADSAVIGCVRTHKNYYNRGYGSSVCISMGNELLKENKKVFICCEKSVFPFYEKIGYKKYGKWWYSEI